MPDSATEAVELLAEQLHFKMEHLDPTEDAVWQGLTERRKEFYRACVFEVIRDKSLVEKARGG